MLMVHPMAAGTGGSDAVQPVMVIPIPASKYGCAAATGVPAVGGAVGALELAACGSGDGDGVAPSVAPPMAQLPEKGEPQEEISAVSLSAPPPKD
jgi:hypothetical protein